MDSFPKWNRPFPVAGFSYFKKQSKENRKDDINSILFSEPSGALKQYIEANNLVPSYPNDEYIKFCPDHYLDTSVIKSLKGLDYFRCFYEKHFHDVMLQDVTVSEQEKNQLNQNATLYVAFKPNDRIEKQKGFVHSGVIFTIVDNMSGDLAFISSNMHPCLTAYLNLQFKKSLEVGKDYVCVLQVDKVQNNKVFTKGKVVDLEGNVYLTNDALFIKTSPDSYPKCTFFKKLIKDRHLQKLNESTTRELKSSEKLSGQQ